MCIEPQAVSKTLGKRHRPGVGMRQLVEVELALGGASQVRKDLIEEDAEHDQISYPPQKISTS
jgi:hypothetical protein